MRPSLFHALVALLVSASACAEGSEVTLDETKIAPSRDPSGRVPDSAANAPSGHGADAGASPGPADGSGPASSSEGGLASSTACASALAALRFDFEAGAQGWTHGVSDGGASPPEYPHDPWTLGVSTVGAACAAGSCFGTELSKNYAQCQRGYLLSPPLDLSACAGLEVDLVFRHAYAFWTDYANGKRWYDGGVVEVSGDDGATWVVPPSTAYPGTVKISPAYASTICTNPSFGVDGKRGYIGLQTLPKEARLRVPPSALQSKTRVRFSFASGASSMTIDADESRLQTNFGWRVDDISFELQ